MPFCVQYDTATGAISDTVNTGDQPAPGPMPDGRGQLEFYAAVPTDGKRVNLTTLALEDIPPS